MRRSLLNKQETAHKGTRDSDMYSNQLQNRAVQYSKDSTVPYCVYSFIHGNEFIVVNTIGSLSCYPHESCVHVERLEWLAWFILGYLNGFL